MGFDCKCQVLCRTHISADCEANERRSSSTVLCTKQQRITLSCAYELLHECVVTITAAYCATCLLYTLFFPLYTLLLYIALTLIRGRARCQNYCKKETLLQPSASVKRCVGIHTYTMHTPLQSGCY
jgi:hypothetical protein